MKIIIVGLGETGITLVKALANDKHDITVIDKDSALVDSVTDEFSVNGVAGSGASKETLLKAGVQGADIFIALTHIDEVNLLSCMQAKNCGASKTVARLQMPDLSADVEALKKEYGIDYIVRPRIDIAEEIYRNLGLPGFVKLEDLFGDTVTVIDIAVMRDSCLKGRTPAYIRANICRDMLISTVTRGDKLFIPDGNFVLEEGDFLTVCVSDGGAEQVLSTLGVNRNREGVMMVGCGVIGEYLAERLIKEGRQPVILENDIDRCRRLMDRFPTAHVAYAAGEITEVLADEGLAKTGTLISLTDSDETNLVISMFAWARQVPSVVTKVDKQSHVRLLHKVNIDITASPTELSLQRIMHYIRNRESRQSLRDVLGKNLKLSKHRPKENDTEFSSYYGFCRVADGRAEVMEFGAGRDFKVLDTPIREKDFRLKKGILISGIIRNGELLIPTGDSCVKEGDRVLVTAPVEKGIRMLNDILG